jgi:hypothetical protein
VEHIPRRGRHPKLPHGCSAHTFVLYTFHQLKGLGHRPSASEVHRTAAIVVAKDKLASVPFWVPLKEGRKKSERRANFELTKSGNSSVKDEFVAKNGNIDQVVSCIMYGGNYGL